MFKRASSSSQQIRLNAPIWTSSSNVFTPKIATNAKKASGSRGFAYDDLLKWDTVNLDIFWIRDESQKTARICLILTFWRSKIAEELEAALEQFSAIAEDLKRWTLVRLVKLQPE
jgi:hypothetical protein